MLAQRLEDAAEDFQLACLHRAYVLGAMQYRGKCALSL